MKKFQKGLTLIELMVTLAVAIVMMAVGVPLYQGLASSNRAAVQSNAFVAALALARSEAVKRNQTVILCSDVDTNQSTLVCGDEDDWANGWILFADEDADGALDNGEVIRVWGALANSSIMTTVTSTASLQFSSDGSVNAPAEFKMELSHCSGKQARVIDILTSGQVRADKEDCT